MSPKVAVLVILGALILGGVAWVLWAPTADEAAQVDPASTEPQEAVVTTTDQPMTPASLYFLGADGWLHGVEIEVPEEDGEGRIWALVNALIAGPRGSQDSGLASPVPQGVRLDGVYFMGPSSVALDLRFQAAAPAGDAAANDDPEADPETPAPSTDIAATEATSTVFGRMGSKQEMLTVYSLVNTVAMGSDAVERVVLLIDGKQPETLAGHVDLTRPLRPDSSWIHESSRADG